MSEVMSEVTFDAELDARGLNCQMPLVKARKQIGSLDAGQVLKIVSTDRGSIKDFQGWAKIAANIELLAQETATENDQDLFLHYVKRVN
jgi:TusA-related sulfurtransferase